MLAGQSLARESRAVAAVSPWQLRQLRPIACRSVSECARPSKRIRPRMLDRSAAV